MDDLNKVPTNASNTEVPAKDSPKTPAPKKKSKVGLIIGLVVAVLLIIGLLIGWGVMTVINSANAPAKTSSELIGDIQVNKTSAAYNLLSDEAKSTISEDEFDKLIGKIGPVLNGEPKKISSQVNTDNGKTTAVVTYEIKGSDNNTYLFTVTLVKNNDTWQIQEFESKVK